MNRATEKRRRVKRQKRWENRRFDKWLWNEFRPYFLKRRDEEEAERICSLPTEQVKAELREMGIDPDAAVAGIMAKVRERMDATKAARIAREETERAYYKR